MSFCCRFGALIISIVGIKLFRQCYSYTSCQYKILLFTVLFFEFDYHGYSETFPIDYYIMSIIVGKIEDLVLKMEVCQIKAILMFLLKSSHDLLPNINSFIH